MLRNKNKKMNAKVIKRSNIVMLIVVVASYLTHLGLANHAANQRYALAHFITQRESLQTEKQKLGATVAELQSSNRLSADSARLNLVKVQQTYYIAAKSAVVLNR